LERDLDDINEDNDQIKLSKVVVVYFTILTQKKHNKNFKTCLSQVNYHPYLATEYSRGTCNEEHGVPEQSTMAYKLGECFWCRMWWEISVRAANKKRKACVTTLPGR